MSPGSDRASSATIRHNVDCQKEYQDILKTGTTIMQCAFRTYEKNKKNLDEKMAF